MPQSLHDLFFNLRTGTLLTLFIRPWRSVSRLRVSLGQLVLLGVFNLGLVFVCDLIRSLPAPQLYPTAIVSHGFGVASFLLGIALAGAVLARERAPLVLSVALFSMSPAIYLVGRLLYSFWEVLLEYDGFGSAGWILFAWALAAMFVPFWSFGAVFSKRVVTAFTVLIVVGMAPSWYFTGEVRFWYQVRSNQAEDDTFKAYENLDAERLFYDQPRLVRAGLTQLAPQRPGVTDLYFVGFASYARQDVFRNEISYGRELFEQRFDGAGRSINLINNLATIADTPLASGSNLQLVLADIGQRIDVQEDVVALMLTSHGSRKHELAVDFWPLPLNDLTPHAVKGYLDEAGIKWRVLIVSACYSGGYIEPLKDPHTLILTAAASDRQSFGCSHEREFTYFGEALLRDQLAHRYSFIDAFRAADQAIGERERVEDLEASRPQIFIGSEVEAKLEELQQRLQMASQLSLSAP